MSKFQTKQLSYLQRLKKEFLYGFLILTALVFYTHFKFSGTIGITTIWIGFFGLGFAIAAHLKARTCFHEIEIQDGTLTLRGDSANKPIIIKLPISETNIVPKSKGHGRGRVEYFIRFKHDNKIYDVNRLFNWEYSTLLELFHEFKKQKNEKIIWDEKFVLENMEKKVKKTS